MLGPQTRSVVAQEVDAVTHEELIGLARQILRGVETEGHLPANVETSNGRVGLSQFAVLAAKAYLALARYDQFAKLTVPFVLRYPDIANALDTWICRYIGEHWAMPLDFSCERMAEQARLQAWTVKPAWQRPPQGAVADHVYGPRVSLR